MADTSSPPLVAYLFGPAELWLHGAPLRGLRSRKERWLISLLILHAGRELERDWLAARLWPTSTKPIAQANLRRILNELRRVLGKESCLLRAPQSRTLLLDPGDVDADVLAFHRLIARGDPASLERAVGLYRGPLLEGCHEEWALQERQVREAAYLNALERLAAGAMAQAEFGSAVGYLRRIVATDPLREEAHRALMQSLAAGGNYAAALALYRDLRLLLHREVNAQPDPETQSLFHQICAEAHGKAAPGFRLPAPGKDGGSSHAGRLTDSLAESREPRVESRSVATHNLPYSTTSFVGRERELEEVPWLLESTRLLTLTGAGGCGKSRLALEVGRRLCDRTPDGVWSVELAALADPALVPQAVSAALGARERPGEALTDALVRFLRPKRPLLLLDNCEHLLPACAALIDALLRGCPNLQVLATSREPLSMLGETTYRIPSLPHGDAVRLFADRAAAAQPGFDLTENAESVARICGWLDGIPLAIEMAATRSRALPVETLADRLEDSLRLLTDGNRVALPRHRTLRAMIDWSHDLLSAPEKALLRRLAVFAGGWTIEAAEAVWGGLLIDDCRLLIDGNPAPSPISNQQSAISNEEVLDLLTKLVDKSLVLYENRTGEWRCRLLEPMRQFAQEHLTASGEDHAIRRRHAGYYLALAETAERQLTGPNRQVWLDRLAQERDNMRAALGWAAATAAPGGAAAEVGLRLAAALWQFWHIRGDYTEGRGWLKTVLGLLAGDAHREAAVPPIVRARAHEAAGQLAWPQGDARAVQTHFAESLSLAQELGDRPLIANSLFGLGTACWFRGELAAARAHGEKALAIARELGDRHLIRRFCNNLGVITRLQGEYERSRSLVEESLRIAREMGERHNTPPPIWQLGKLWMIEGDYPKALAYFEESLAIAQEVGDQRMVAIAYRGLGTLARYQGDLEAARRHYVQSVRMDHALGGLEGLKTCLIGLGCIEILSGESAGKGSRAMERRHCRGIRLLGAAEGLQETTGRAVPPDTWLDYERCVAVARAGLGEEGEPRFGASGSERQRRGPCPGFAAAWAEGQALSLDEACDLALAEEDTDDLTAVRPGTAP